MTQHPYSPYGRSPYGTAPSPGVGEVITQSFGLLRRRPGLFFGLGAVPAAASMLVALVMLWVLWLNWPAVMTAIVRQDLPAILGAVGAWFGIAMLGGALAGLIGVVVNGLLTRLAGDLLAGRQPTLGELLRTAGGFLGRILPLLLLGVVVYVLAAGVILLPFLLSLGSLTNPSDTQAIASGVLVMMLLFFVVGILALFFAIRLVYLVQVIALEQLGWLAALRRAWTITAGAFWRTLGTLLVANLLVYVATMAVSLVTQGLSAGTLADLENVNPMGQEFLSLMLGAMIVPIVAQAILQVATLPFLQSVVTVMYVNRLRELARPAQPATPYPPAPYGYPAAPGYAPGYPSASGFPPAPGYPPAGYGPGGQPPQPGQSPYPQAPQYPVPGYGQPPSYPGHGQPWPPQPQPPQGYPGWYPGQVPPAQPPAPQPPQGQPPTGQQPPG